ncbi:MAG: hypothetical protein Hyperionvirus5_98 [Hyperionvirus sp.]|uniref:Uncharacterized protein n=1 Tax=Hyperionvirus sp. TaxID=2487770 RepID=A0A3G5A8A2_9VIRU|nr:MAG: hypothetical protein Hyperionvirus5_98 [Hyperionvirus sp.]
MGAKSSSEATFSEITADSPKFKEVFHSINDTERKKIIDPSTNMPLLIAFAEQYELLPNDTKVNLTYADQLYKKCREANYPRGYYKAGLLRFHEPFYKNVLHNMDEGFAWLQKAAELNDPDAQIWMGNYYARIIARLNGETVILTSTPTGMAHDEKETSKLREREKKYVVEHTQNAKKNFESVLTNNPNNIQALISFGQLSLRSDKGFGLKLLNRAAELGSAEAYFELGKYHHASHYYLKAIEINKNYPKALFYLATDHSNDCKANGTTSEELLRRANSLKSIKFLSQAYRYGKLDIAPDETKADEYNHKLIELDDFESICEIAYYYTVKKKYVYAIKLLWGVKYRATGQDRDDINNEVNRLMIENQDELLNITFKSFEG